MARGKAIVAWSSGKDAAWALHVLRAKNEIDVVGLLTTIDASRARVAMHDVPRALLVEQCEAIGLPLFEVGIPWPCPNAEYERTMSAAMVRAKSDGVTHVAFGDLFLEDIRKYREEKLASIGMTPIFPLWGKPTDRLAREMIEGGLRAKITCVDTTQLDAKFAGRDFDLDFLRDLPLTVDPCGERGEMHTFVFDGPMFARAVPVKVHATTVRDRFAYAELSP